QPESVRIVRLNEVAMSSPPAVDPNPSSTVERVLKTIGVTLGAIAAPILVLMTRLTASTLPPFFFEPFGLRLIIGFPVWGVIGSAADLETIPFVSALAVLTTELLTEPLEVSWRLRQSSLPALAALVSAASLVWLFKRPSRRALVSVMALQGAAIAWNV